ncbi:hypothetical protein CVT25_000823 [Psilocybe cyanescens]|uniref:MHD domain-containing protein n=1 Tax=Psilocybe cyanescens TaxID=93625 RepID=A0A409XSD0_PSICY|nr:hypothetical protein CVT25_000823 [Psilocybe cyanescens]
MYPITRASLSHAEQNFEKSAPITVKLEIPYFTVSGIQVRYLKIVERSGYQALPWVRSITQNDDDYSSRTALEKGSAPIMPMYVELKDEGVFCIWNVTVWLPSGCLKRKIVDDTVV